jgi:dissimilatory sulfite reductase (desulfoviridin) alpha/beta subunit
MDLTNEQRIALKLKGYITSRDKDFFSCRVLVFAGKMTAVQAQKLGEVSQKYGRGYFTLTQRSNVHIPWIQYKDLENITKELKEVGLCVGGVGPKVRPAHNCKGTVCQYGLIDTEAVSEQISERFYKQYCDVKLPGKLRIEVGGCPNNCARPQFGCIGIQGRESNKVAISIGGMFGKNNVDGKMLAGLYSLTEAMNIIEKVIHFYKNNGLERERFAMTVERIGFENVEKVLLTM